MESDMSEGSSFISWPRLEAFHTVVFDFDGVFTDNKVYVFESGEEAVRCDRADGLGIDFLRRHRELKYPNLEFFILSRERNRVVATRAEKLRIECWQAISDKLAHLTAYFEARHLGKDPFRGLIYFGNDLNDLPIIHRAGFSIVPGDAHESVKKVASVVMKEKGGCGFVRAAIEKLLRLEAMTLEELNELVSYR